MNDAIRERQRAEAAEAAEAEVERLQDFFNELAERMPPEFDGDEAQEYLIDNWITSLMTENATLRAEVEDLRALNAGDRQVRDDEISNLRAALAVRDAQVARVEALVEEAQYRNSASAHFSDILAALADPAPTEEERQRAEQDS